MTYLYKPLARKNFKTGENMFYPAPLPAAVTDFELLAAEISAKCTLTRADAMGVLKELERQSSTRCYRVTPFALAHWGRFALLRSQ